MLWDAAHGYGKLPTLDSGQSTVTGSRSARTGARSRPPATDGQGGALGLLLAGYDRAFAALKAKVCGLVHGNLTKAEWETVAPGLPYSTTCPD